MADGRSKNAECPAPRRSLENESGAICADLRTRDAEDPPTVARALDALNISPPHYDHVECLTRQTWIDWGAGSSERHRIIESLGIPLDRYDEWEKALDTAYQSGQRFGMTIAHDSPLGTIHYDCRLYPQRDGTGPVTRVIAVCRDISRVVATAHASAAAEARMARLLQQQVAINDLAMALGLHTRLEDVFRTIHSHLRQLVDTFFFVIASYDPQKKLIRAEYACADQELDVSKFPPIPLDESGTATQSRVIIHGEPVYYADFKQATRKNKHKYTVEKDGEVHEEESEEADKKDTTRSAVFLPMKLAGSTVGVMQVQSSRLDAFSEEDRMLLAGMANVAAVAVQNARLIETVEHELDERKRAEAERETLQRQLLQSQKMEAVGRLAGGVAHDFNNMLSVIMGYAEMALEDIAPRSPMWEELQEIRAAGQRAGTLTRQLLAFSRAQEAEPQLIDLNEGVGGMIKMIRRLIGEDIELVFCPCSEPLNVSMDPGHLDQILVNLCVNARDAIATGGTITVNTQMASLDEDSCLLHVGTSPGEYVNLIVTDSGCGMSEDVLEHLFEPFFTTKEAGKGTGLGLATVYGIVQQSGGAIDVESIPGQGALFRVWIPRVSEDQAEPGKSPKSDLPRGHGECILLVEDEVALLRIMRQMLQRLNYHVIAESDPLKALDRADAQAAEIQLLVSDVIMPSMSGAKLATTMCARHPNIRRLFVSGYTADVLAREGIQSGDELLLHKPFAVGDLARAVRRALDAPNAPEA